jgi:FtsP/CotA-like multicopper oxidase with cupredoxin domain
MTLTRRSMLRLLGSLALAPLVASGCSAGGLLANAGGEQVDTVGKVRFDRPLAIPPLAPSRHDGQRRRVFDLTAQTGQREFLAGRPTPTWGLNGDYLGPTLRASRGEQVLINVHNTLPETTSLHWHGMHLPASADGGPHQPIAPGQTWSPSWRIDQPAATLWYHPHPHGHTERHVYRGLAGMFILDDDLEAALQLPREYGIDDIPVIVQDKRFGDDGRFAEGEHRATGLLGDTLLVNGTLGPYLKVTTDRVRLRLLNASTARVYAFGLADHRRFTLIGSDGGLLTAAYETDRIQLSPGERAEILVAVQAGEEAVLRSFPPALGTGRQMTAIAGGEDTLDVLQLRAASSLAPSGPPPGRLAEVPRLEPAEAAATRTFQLAGRQINGKKLNIRRIDEVVTKDTAEVWEVTNHHAQPHSFHVHDVQFQILSIGGAAPPPPLAGWKDAVYLPPRVPIRIIMRFADYADPGHPYMYHCHLLFHEDSGMMGQFVVVEPGQHAQQPDAPGGHNHGRHP